MGKLIGTTFPIITGRVGKGGATSGKEVKRINQLLRLAGYLKTGPENDLIWGAPSIKALSDFYNACRITSISAEYIDSKDAQDNLATLAYAAKVLIRLPNGLRSGSALTVLYNTCRSSGYPYSWVKGDSSINRAIWGFEGRPQWAIATTNDKFFPTTIPVALNCTSFANLMLSVWMQGNTHSSPYDASQMVGGYDPLSARYNMHPLNDGNMMVDGYCFDLDTIKQMTKPDRLYHFASCDQDGKITHDMVLLNGLVYESNKIAPYVYTTTLDKRFKGMVDSNKCPRVFGPSPF